MSVLEQFLSLECTASVRGLLEHALAEQGERRQLFELNLFDITVDPVEGVVLIQDIIGPSAAGLQRMTTAEFGAALARCSAKESGDR